MKRLNIVSMSAALLGLALSLAAVAQTQDFPRTRTSAASCADVRWNQMMLQSHPFLIEACREVIDVEGQTWARFAANLVRVDPNGDVIFSLRDSNDRSIGEVSLVPVPGQVAYINDRATPFREVRPTDLISLYVPENQYGFATKPGAPPEQLARIVDRPSTARAAPVATTQTTVARNDTRAAMLPKTASPLSWLVLTGFLSLLGGLGLMLRRRNQEAPAVCKI